MHRNPRYPHTAGEITERIHRLVGCCEELKPMCRQKFPVGMVLSCLISSKQQWAWLPHPPLFKTWKMRLSAFAVSLRPLYWIAKGYQTRVHICSSVLIPWCSVHLDNLNYAFTLLIYTYKAFYTGRMGERIGLGVGSWLEPESYN